ncbi:hypothetical protein [Metapseudomonas resinovorans]|uniref:Uncharacterized protein n=1 Tax=Metapseudomonas resinovorans NBRC 106553 TaxID=1245471 RepID=S6AL67_METRE|nr:hypothetical protein [Pseudomonas resinovorans]BAN49470.1 hypothetical protein PCA10_37380 [Pseudomonas resinovorans NBRC 106553]
MTESPAPAEPQSADEAEPQPHPWADLAAETFELLRLAPLPIDRHTGSRPLRFVELGRVERHSKEQSLLRLSVGLPGQRVHKEQNLLEVWVDHRSKEVRFGPDGGLSLEPLNRGLGRFLLAQGIGWAKQRWAHYRVEGGALPTRDALDNDLRLRRDHVLKAQGFTVEYQDNLQLKANYGAGRVSELHGDWHREKVQPVSLQDAAAMLEQADQNLQRQEVEIRKLEERIAVYKREDGGLRFTITCLVAFAVFQAGLLIWITTH